MKNKKYELEGGEMFQDTQGQMTEFKGPSHSQGGIDVNLPAGTVYSKRLKRDGKTMVERKKAREKRIEAAFKNLEKNPMSQIARNTMTRVAEVSMMEEMDDVNFMESKRRESSEKMAYGGKTGKGEKMATGGSTNPDPSLALFKAWAVENGIDLGPDANSTAWTPALKSLRQDNIGPYLDWEVKRMDDRYVQPIESGMPRGLNRGAKPDPNSPSPRIPLPIDKYRPAPRPDQTVPMLETPLPESVATVRNGPLDPQPIGLPIDDLIGADIEGSVDGKGLPLSYTPDTGEDAGGGSGGASPMPGSIAGSLASLFTTLANRAGDTGNPNFYEDYGKRALAENSREAQMYDYTRDLGLDSIASEALGGYNRNRGNSRSLSTMSARDAGVSTAAMKARQGVLDSYSRNLGGVSRQRAGLLRDRDDKVMSGARAADIANQQDRDAFYTNLSANLTNLGNGGQAVQSAQSGENAAILQMLQGLI